MSQLAINTTANHPYEAPPKGCVADSRLELTLRAGKFAVTSEMNPPDSADPADVFEAAEPLVAVSDAINLTDASGASESYFIDGGFVQVKGPVVSVLTNAAVPTSELSRKAAATQLENAKAERTKTDEQYAAASRRLEKARKMLALASRD